MRIAVRYQSRSGNTKKVAEAIARKSGVVAKPLDPAEKFSPAADLLFVGGPIYAGNPHKNVTKALAALTAGEASGAAFFYTSAMPPPAAMDNRFKAAVKDPAIVISDAVFQCPGKFLFTKRDRPNGDDLEKAEAFAKRAIEVRRKTLEEKKWRE